MFFEVKLRLHLYFRLTISTYIRSSQKRNWPIPLFVNSSISQQNYRLLRKFMATIKKIKVRQRFVFPTKNHNEYSTIDTSYTFVHYMHSVYFTISEFRINGEISTVCSSLKCSNDRSIRFSRNESSQDINEPYLRKLVYCTTMTKNNSWENEQTNRQRSNRPFL